MYHSYSHDLTNYLYNYFSSTTSWLVFIILSLDTINATFSNITFVDILMETGFTKNRSLDQTTCGIKFGFVN
ncbi:dubious [Schizosaccharomyces pombe]|uniref:Uncharacterized protein C336.16 n=1 Tax=Schizosaccharomyces pombe (strain 972 / ATCC 24843) TaxID=284812 RepID=YGOG_SCHPO|nr:uncharacterized protein SPBC336.16 [Schizosaccharomyces pombe]G2TRR0.1 RecName: Full=Uncharacterized protein C336.16 [Schizosaccharomyces pombe 972h-]CCD31373.1 sequence orphan [Schizosaccharomyces pombe]|eukprot:NP_001343163.1 uncharacterized protein SPBC336.16 [Schizosaccharomyces pombe]